MRSREGGRSVSHLRTSADSATHPNTRKISEAIKMICILYGTLWHQTFTIERAKKITFISQKISNHKKETPTVYKLWTFMHIVYFPQHAPQYQRAAVGWVQHVWWIALCRLSAMIYLPRVPNLLDVRKRAGRINVLIALHSSSQPSPTGSRSGNTRTYTDTPPEHGNENTSTRDSWRFQGWQNHKTNVNGTSRLKARAHTRIGSVESNMLADRRVVGNSLLEWSTQVS